MDIKTNYNDLNDISVFINSKCDEINLNYKEITEIIEKVSSNWMGKDSVEFVEEAKKQIEEEKERLEVLRKFSEALSTISKDYREMDNQWNETIKRESLDNG